MGHFLIRKTKGKILKGIITETEAYVGSDDPACHAAGGKTERNCVMFGFAGKAYVYFTYGMYHCLNIVTEREGFPAAVLIRGIKPVVGMDIMRRNRSKFKIKSQKPKTKNLKLADGPGKLCVALDIDLNLNGEDVINGNKLWVENNPVLSLGSSRFYRIDVKKTPRVGISKGKSKKWRFVLEYKKHGV